MGLLGPLLLLVLVLRHLVLLLQRQVARLPLHHGGQPRRGRSVGCHGHSSSRLPAAAGRLLLAVGLLEARVALAQAGGSLTVLSASAAGVGAHCFVLLLQLVLWLRGEAVATRLPHQPAQDVGALAVVLAAALGHLLLLLRLLLRL